MTYRQTVETIDPGHGRSLGELLARRPEPQLHHLAVCSCGWRELSLGTREAAYGRAAAHAWAVHGSKAGKRASSTASARRRRAEG